jgi:cation:H+ antiporter
MLYDIAAILAGFLLLVWSADRFVAGAAATARNLNVSPLIIGLTIVGFGTSAPEMLVSAIASLNGNPGLAVGNAIGSNIANITLVLGIAAVIRPLDVHSRILRKELPLLLVAMLLALTLLQDEDLGRADGMILLSMLLLLLWWMTGQALKNRNTDPMDLEYSKELSVRMSMPRAIFWLLVGLAVLIGSSKLLVIGAVNIAAAFGVSDLVIGLTVIAIGTSLPELATSIAGALKNEHDIVIGNVVGSNLFNTLAVLGIPGLLNPARLDAGVLDRDIPTVFVLTIALVIMAYGFRGPGRINRIEGAVLFAGFVGYQILLYNTAI